jgi:hypothetical protein
VPFLTTLRDPVAGEVPVDGRLGGPEGARDLVVILHGLGGTVESRYAVLAARAAHAEGLASLRLHLRGADRRGADLYHAGLTADLQAALESPALERFERVYVLGYSLGGHVALRWAALQQPAGRVRALAAVCPPIDLAAGVGAIQRLDRRPYQFHVLRGLKAHYAAVARRHGEGSRVAPVSLADALSIRDIRTWDERIIAPRFGFDGADDYYASAGVGPHLPDITLPSLVVAAEADPMIPDWTTRPLLRRAGRAVHVAWMARGGHVGFPDDVTLPLPAAAPRSGLERGVLAWLRTH